MEDLSFTCYPDDHFMICANNDRALSWLNDNVDHDEAGTEDGLWVNAWVTGDEFERAFEKAKADGLLVGDIAFALGLTDAEHVDAQERARERGISVEEAVKERLLFALEGADQAQKPLDEFLRKRAEAKGKRK
jgi:hypothetical protein